jgi:hypothetical protein
MNRLQTKRKGAPRAVRLRIVYLFVDPLAAVAVRERRGPGDRSKLERIRHDKLAIGLPDNSPLGSVAGLLRNRGPRRLDG